MKKIIAKIDFSINGVDYLKGEEVLNLRYDQIIKLNEKGFVEPLEYRDLVLIKRELDKPKNFLKKEDNL